MRGKRTHDYCITMVSKMDTGNGVYFLVSTKEFVYFVEIIERILLRRRERVYSSSFRTDKSIEKRLIELVGYSQMWQMVHKCSPIIERQVQNKFVEMDY